MKRLMGVLVAAATVVVMVIAAGADFPWHVVH